MTGDLEELRQLLSHCTREGVKRIIEAEVDKLSDKKVRLEREVTAAKNAGNESHPLHGSVNYTTVTNYAWDQSNEHVKIYIELQDKDLPLSESDIILSVPSKRSVVLIFGKKKLSLSQLHSDISKEGTHFKLRKNKISLFLKKDKEGTHWSSMKDTTDSWKKSMEENKDDLSDDPSAGLMKLMKKMYDEGDDEMKRTIAKSWYESKNKDPTAELGNFGN